MPAKSICNLCGQKYRSSTHICHPNSVDKRNRFKAAHSALEAKQK